MPIPNSASATWAVQAEPDAVDFEIISAAHSGHGVISGCACTPASSGVNLGVAVASGSVCVDSATPIAVTGATVTPGAAHATLARFDLVVVSNAGALSIVAGTALAVPVFPAIPAARTVLAVVYLPAAATSITIDNIVDKRQMVVYTPQFGTTSTTAAAGNHLHSGEYASTLHADTHLGTGSDPITQLGGFEIQPSDGTGAIHLQAQMTEPTAWPEDDHISIYARWMGYRPVLAVHSLDREMFFGSEIMGPENIVVVQANTGTTAPTVTRGIPVTTTGTFSAPAASTTLGFRQSVISGAVSGNVAQIGTTDLRWTRGDSALPWCGYCYHARLNFSTALTSSRLWIGMTDQTAATMGAADDPAGHRHMFRLINGTGNFFMSTKNGTTQALYDTGMAFALNNVYDFYLFVRPGGDYCFGQINNLTAATTSGALIDISGAASAPGTTTFMRAMVCVATTTTLGKIFEFHRFGCEIPV